MFILTVVVTVAPSAVVAVTVRVDGPVGVGVFCAVVQPTSPPAANMSRPSVRYIGMRRKGSARCRTAPSMASRAAITDHSREVDHGPRPPIPGTDGEDPNAAPGVGIALIVIVELPELAPAAIVPPFTVQVAPVSDCGTAQVTVSAAGNGTFAGLVK